eukprot:TRINITY_DN2207_c0_g1_i3.p1 TRINITY_DN2207_c0_g1~~TRINITY_DN2207_c0_g1_i3.p1  ORF type:complete len:202 (+),score=-31.13 TRINITY_DN2207_c0_g1_i3:538-1143(+)
MPHTCITLCQVQGQHTDKPKRTCVEVVLWSISVSRQKNNYSQNISKPLLLYKYQQTLLLEPISTTIKIAKNHFNKQILFITRTKLIQSPLLLQKIVKNHFNKFSCIELPKHIAQNRYGYPNNPFHIPPQIMYWRRGFISRNLLQHMHMYRYIYIILPIHYGYYKHQCKQQYIHIIIACIQQVKSKTKNTYAYSRVTQYLYF